MGDWPHPWGFSLPYTCFPATWFSSYFWSMFLMMGIFLFFGGLARRTHLSCWSGRWCHEVKVFWFLEKTILDWLGKGDRPIDSKQKRIRETILGWLMKERLIDSKQKKRIRVTILDWLESYLPIVPKQRIRTLKEKKAKIGNDVMCLNCVFVCCYLQHFQLESPPEFVDLFVTHLILSSPI